MSKQQFFNNKEIQEIKNFFSVISEELLKFSEEHNLLIEKYPDQRPVWNLRFAHPENGEAYITVSKNVGSLIDLSGYWFIDNYDEFTKYIKLAPPILIPIKQKNILHQYLTRELEMVYKWKKGDWSSISKGYKDNWGKWTKEKFYALKKKLLLPKIAKEIARKYNDTPKLIVICPNCKYENTFNQPYLYHAGFGDQGFLYNDAGNATLIWHSYDKTFTKLFPSTHPWMLTFEQRKNFESMLLPAPKGGMWRFGNVARCLQCREKIMDSSLSNVYYLEYDDSINTEKLKEGLSEVIKHQKHQDRF